MQFLSLTECVSRTLLYVKQTSSRS